MSRKRDQAEDGQPVDALEMDGKCGDGAPGHDGNQRSVGPRPSAVSGGQKPLRPRIAAGVKDIGCRGNDLA